METVKLAFVDMDLIKVDFNLDDKIMQTASKVTWEPWLNMIPDGVMVAVNLEDFIHMGNLTFVQKITFCEISEGCFGWLMYDVLPNSFIENNKEHIFVTGLINRDHLNKNNISFLNTFNNL